MNFRDVPNLLKFEQYARGHSDSAIVLDCYKRIRDLIGPVPRPPEVYELADTQIDGLKASCAAVEKATRLVWACAAATDQISPRLWDYVPDYEASVDYFQAQGDLELMAVTQKHRVNWEIVIPV